MLSKQCVGRKTVDSNTAPKTRTEKITREEEPAQKSWLSSSIIPTWNNGGDSTATSISNKLLEKRAYIFVRPGIEASVPSCSNTKLQTLLVLREILSNLRLNVQG
jgi:hypothetical protein